MAAAIAEYEEQHRVRPQRRYRLTFFMPVNIRSIKGIQADIAASAAGGAGHWGNQIGPVLERLPLFDSRGGRIAAEDRLRAVRALLRPKKSSLGPILLSLVVRALCRAFGSYAAYRVLDRLGRSTTTLISNMPGPQEPVSVMGHQITGMCNVVNGTPQGAQFSILTYDSALRLACSASADVIPEPKKLMSLFVDNLRELGKAYHVEPYPAVSHLPIADRK
uniref:O-acyltransferase (Wsd1-like) family protein n=1 Tax=Tetraselmis sp. GSL018 TaxID=582737 RepID=A0A061RGZ8_9CHLO